MVHALHDEGFNDPVTVRLDIRYRRAVAPGSLIVVAASIEKRRGGMVWLEGSLSTGGTDCATATGVFRVESRDLTTLRLAEEPPLSHDEHSGI
ncbi:MAG: hypothetical protein IPH75_00720 [bacterium]|nr:hypothetical protein [bacterium]